MLIGNHISCTTPFTASYVYIRQLRSSVPHLWRSDRDKGQAQSEHQRIKACIAHAPAIGVFPWRTSTFTNVHTNEWAHITTCTVW